MTGAVLISAIASLLTAVVGLLTFYYGYYLPFQTPIDKSSTTASEPPETPPSPEPTIPPVDSNGPNPKGNSLSVETDAKSYGYGDHVKINGSVGKPVEGKTVRLDVYDSKGNAFDSLNGTESDIQVRPNDKGQFSYRFQLEPFLLIEFGTYRIDVTYDGMTKNATFTVR